MNLTISTKAELGQAATVTYTLDGYNKRPNYELSRKLTDTASECDQGIFSNGTIEFSRGNAEVKVDIYWNSLETDPQTLHDMIRANIDSVHRAFAAKYPAKEISVTEIY